MNSKTALEKKYEIIKQNLGNQTTFYTDEVIPLFPELKKSTLYWNLSKLVEAGYIKRVRNGVFSFNDLKGRQGIILCETAQKLKNYMDELGFYYYISGLDILQNICYTYQNNILSLHLLKKQQKRKYITIY